MGILDAPSLSKAQGDRRYRKGLSSRDIKFDGNQVDTTQATIGTYAAASAITNAKYWACTTTLGTTTVLNYASHYAITGGFNINIYSSVNPNYNYIWPECIAFGGGGSMVVDFMHDGDTNIEIRTRNATGYALRLSVDGKIVGGAVSSTNQFLPITFPSIRPRRIHIEFSGAFAGIYTGPNGTIWKPASSGPAVLIFGDSYTYGQGATYTGASNYVRSFANTLGLQNVSASGVGGTGWMNPGTNPGTSAGQTSKAYDRLSSDVLAGPKPDYLIWAMGHNDTTYAQSDIQAQITLCVNAVKAWSPNTQQILLSPMWAQGVEAYAGAILNQRDTHKAAALALGIPFIDCLEIPLETTPITSTVASISGIGSPSIVSTALFPVQSTIHIGPSSAGTRRTVTAVSGSGPYTLTLSKTLTIATAVGDAITQVGAALFTGTGNVSAPTGAGNCDTYLSADGAHPTQLGHDALGIFLGTQMARYIL